jgi:tungstate transport system substrate-binding protein
MKAPQCFTLAFVLFLGHASIAAEQSSPQSIILASTTSVENSGLLAAILPAFTKETGITVHVLALRDGPGASDSSARRRRSRSSA